MLFFKKKKKSIPEIYVGCCIILFTRFIPYPLLDFLRNNFQYYFVLAEPMMKQNIIFVFNKCFGPCICPLL